MKSFTRMRTTSTKDIVSGEFRVFLCVNTKSALLGLLSVLQPANKYNIQEKVKEANQTLLVEMKLLEKSAIGATSERRVTFRSNLEDYEPNEEISEQSENEDIEELDEELIFEEDVEVEVEQETLESALDKLAIEEDNDNDDGDLEDSQLLDEFPKLIITTTTYPSNVQAETTIKTLTKRPKKPIPKANPVTNYQKYKSCCEQKNRNPADFKLLPGYIGAVSEYGLTSDQLRVKKERTERQRRRNQENAFIKYQQMVERNRINEEAFAKWMNQKLTKMPKNKYANRYDDKGAPKKRNVQELPRIN